MRGLEYEKQQEIQSAHATLHRLALVCWRDQYAGSGDRYGLFVEIYLILIVLTGIERDSPL